MALSELSPAKAILLAVQLAHTADIQSLEALVSQQRNSLRTELVLRILLSHLPESLDSSEYVPFIEHLTSGTFVQDFKSPIDTSVLDELHEYEAKKKVRKLHLLSLAWEDAPRDAPTEPLILFLMHRSLRIDKNTGLITQVPELLSPFLHLSAYLRIWTISTIIPLVRLNYEYHPEDGAVLTIPKFEALDDRAGVSLLLSRTGKGDGTEASDENTVGRDLRGLIGPWMYGDTRWKRRKLRKNYFGMKKPIEPFDEEPEANYKYVAWEEVYKWIIGQSGTSWRTAVQAVEQWDGPGDADLGSWSDGTVWLDEVDQQHLERRYTRTGIATAYLISEASEDALNGVQRILNRIITLMDKDRIPTLQQAAALLYPVSGLSKDILSRRNTKYLKNELLEDHNVLSAPKEESVKFLHALLVSAFLCTRAGSPLNIRKAGELALLQDEHDQKFRFEMLIFQSKNKQKGDDKLWIRMRNELLWLRGWGAEELSEGADARYGRGILGKLPKELIETEFLTLLLDNSRFELARDLYENSPDPPLPLHTLHDTVISAAMNAYDNATNPNKNRGGVKKCADILKAFSNTLETSIQAEQLEILDDVTHKIGQHRLVFKQGEPFKPVALRVHGDPISILGKILDQNPTTYTKIDEFIDMGEAMVKAGLTVRSTSGRSIFVPDQLHKQQMIARKRVISMCIDQALVEEDFETAYSYVVTRLESIAGPAQIQVLNLRTGPGLYAEPPPQSIDDWSWRAALQAGKYKRTSQTVKPTHLGSASGNLEIRHLEQRMECLALALRIAPKATLHEILNVFRRCEEELEATIQQEAEQEAAWDAQGDDQMMPGGFAATPAKKNVTGKTSRAVEEAPMSLFDLSRASVARAQSGFSALSMLRGNSSTSQETSRPESSGKATPNGSQKPTRKRDQLKNAAVGGLATGVGWLLGAPPPVRDEEESE